MREDVPFLLAPSLLAHLHQQLAKIAAIGQSEECLRRALEALRDVLAVLDATFAHPLAHSGDKGRFQRRLCNIGDARSAECCACLSRYQKLGCYSKCNRVGQSVIVSFQGKAAKDIWERNESKSLPRAHWIRAKALLTIMHATQTREDLRILGEPPTIRLHKLTGDRQGYWSVTIRLPWCITFKFSKGEFSDVMIQKYH